MKCGYSSEVVKSNLAGMDQISKIATVVTLLVAVYVGTRTLLVWRRTRMTPELCIGLNVLTIAAGGLTFAVLKMSGLTASDGVTFQVPRVIGLLFVVAHIPASFATSWKIQKPLKPL